jgi:tRNA nucleotidyltransferase/poly(A) polymerase
MIGTDKDQIAPERMRIEILKAMSSSMPSKFFEALHKIGLLAEIFPSLDLCYGSDHGQYHDENIFDHMMIAGDAIPKAISRVFKATNIMSEDEFALIRLTGYLHDIGKSEPNYKDGGAGEKHFYEHQFSGSKMVSKELKALTFSTDEIKYVFNLILLHMAGSEKMSPKAVRKLIAKFVESDVDWKHWLVIKCADRTGHTRKADNPLKTGKIANKFLHELEDKISHQVGPCFEIKQLAISGSTVRKVLRIGPCQFVGTALDFLLKQVIGNPELNNREDLIFLLTGRSEKATKAAVKATVKKLIETPVEVGLKPTWYNRETGKIEGWSPIIK